MTTGLEGILSQVQDLLFSAIMTELPITPTQSDYALRWTAEAGPQ